MTAYHSHTPEFAADYARRLLAIWPGAAALGLTADPAPPTPQAAPSVLTPALQRQLAEDHANLHATAVALPATKLAIVSQRGAAWPTGKRP